MEAQDDASSSWEALFCFAGAEERGENADLFAFVLFVLLSEGTCSKTNDKRV